MLFVLRVETQSFTMDFTAERIERFDHHGLNCRNKAQKARPRHLHQTTFILGQEAPCYLTSHKQVAHNTVCVFVCMRATSSLHVLLLFLLCQTFSGMSSDGSPLVFRLPEPSYPPQHHNCLDLSDGNAPPHCSLQTHTKEVHGFKAVTAVQDSYSGVLLRPSSSLFNLEVITVLLQCLYRVTTSLLACLLYLECKIKMPSHNEMEAHG